MHQVANLWSSWSNMFIERAWRWNRPKTEIPAFKLLRMFSSCPGGLCRGGGGVSDSLQGSGSPPYLLWSRRCPTCNGRVFDGSVCSSPSSVVHDEDQLSFCFILSCPLSQWTTYVCVFSSPTSCLSLLVPPWCFLLTDLLCMVFLSPLCPVNSSCSPLWSVQSVERGGSRRPPFSCNQD